MSGSIVVLGTPVPQGSANAFIVGKVKPHAVVTHDNAETEPWRDSVRAHARREVGPTIRYLRPAAVHVAVEFVMPRRASAPKRSTPPHTRKPDIDKLTRAVLDALTGVVYEDDSQVTEIDASKREAEPGEQPKASIRWWATFDALRRSEGGSR